MAKIDINPTTKVKDLLENYPELEEELIAMAPPFKKLKNPFLRRSIGKVATIKNIASVADIPQTELINKIRKAVGQEPTTESYDDENYFLEQPEWFSPDKIALTIDDDKVDNKNKMTLVTILDEARDVKKGEIIELITTFLPAPGIDTLKSKGYSVWSKKFEDGKVKSYFLKN